MKSKFMYRSTSATDTGLRKTTNEDSFFDAPQTLTVPDNLERLGSLFAVADGVVKFETRRNDRKHVSVVADA